jgi:hypothetical protein
MAGSLELNTLRDALAAQVATALGEGYHVTTDPRAIDPPTVLVGVPSWTISDARTVTIIFPVSAIAPAPGNDEATRWMLDASSLICPGVDPPVLEGRPGPYDTGAGIYPSLTILVARAIGFC